jgi:hypothetical protein
MTSLVPVNALDITGAATTLLSTLENLLTELGVRLPDRVGIVPGSLVAFDDEQLTVNMVGITRGIAPQAEPAYMTAQAMRQFYLFEVNLLRAVSGLQSSNFANAIPTMDMLADDFATVNADTTALWQAFVTIVREDLIVPTNVPFNFELTLVGPEGSLCGNRVAVNWQAL